MEIIPAPYDIERISIAKAVAGLAAMDSGVSIFYPGTQKEPVEYVAAVIVLMDSDDKTCPKTADDFHYVSCCYGG